MNMGNEVAKYQSSVQITPPPEIDTDRSSWSMSKCWRVEISYNHHVFINDHERDYFLQELSKGKKIIKVGEMVLTNRFLAITKVR